MVEAVRPPFPLEQLCEGVIEAGWLAALVVVPLFFNPYSRQIFEPDKTVLLRLIVLLMSAAWSIKLAGGGRAAAPITAPGAARPGRVPLLVPSLFVLISIAVSTAWSVDIRVSTAGSYLRAQGLWSWLAFLVLFVLALTHLRSARQWRRILYAVTLTSFAVASYAVLQRLGLDPVPWRKAGLRAGATLGNPIFLAAFLGMTFFPILRELSSPTGLEPRGAVAPDLEARFPGRALVWYTLVLQILAIGIAGSRGPMLGLLTGGFLGLLAVLFTARARSLSVVSGWLRALRRWGWLILIGLAVAALAALFAASRVGTPISWRGGRSLGRLAAPFDARSRSASVRLLTWEGGLDLLREGSPIAPRSPLARAARALVGYGPETFRVAFASHNSARSSSIAGRNGIQDRAHNEVLDRLVETGVLGFASWFCWFGVLFFLGATALFPPGRSRAGLYWSLLLGAALTGAAVPALLGAPHLAFFGVPIGMLAGLTVYLGLVSRDRDGSVVAPAWTRGHTLVAAVLASAAAHLVEINLGIEVTATRLYLWFLAAVLVAARQGWLELESPVEGAERAPSREPELGGGLIAGLVVATLVFPLLANPDQASTPVGVVLANLASGAGPVGGPLWLPILVWVAAAATAVSIDRRAPSERSSSALTFAATSLATAGAFLLYHAHRLSRAAGLEARGHPRSEVLEYIAGHAAAYQTCVLLWVLGAGVWLWRKPGSRELRAVPAKLCPRPGRAAAAALLLAAAAVPLVAATLRPLAADAFSKQGVALLDAGDVGSSVPVLRRAVALAPSQTAHAIELGRALVAAAQETPAGPERERSLADAESTLELARSLSPFAPECSANLGSLFAIEATLAVDEEARRSSLARSALELERALELRPEWVNRLADLAVVEYREGNRDRAFGLIDRALELDSANPTAHRALAYLHTGEAAVSEAAGDDQTARDHRARAAAATERGVEPWRRRN